MKNEWDAFGNNTMSVDIKTSKSGKTLPECFCLVEICGSRSGRRYILDKETLIGREPCCNIQIAAEDVSRQHVRILRTTDDNYQLEDLKSHNGTFINGVKIKQPTLLKPEDKIQLGSTTTFIFTRFSPLEDQILQEQKLESLGRLARGVAHDFNNLMAVALADIDFLRRNYLQPAVAKEDIQACLDNIETAARRAADLTKQLLGFARCGKYENRCFNISLLIEEIVNLTRRTFDSSIIVESNIKPQLMIVGDPAQAHQVLLNLCLNARDAMPQGGILMITATFCSMAEEQLLNLPMLSPGDYVLICIEDNGVGMNRETCKKIFDPFFTTKAPGKGSGLGLATAYGIIKNHSGHVEVDSELGQGTIFRIYFPAAEEVTREASEKPTSTALPAIGNNVHSKTILLVEDVEQERKFARQMLEQLGYRVVEAADGREAIKIYLEQRQKIDLIILDMILPNLSGRETFRWLKKINPLIKVLVISGYLNEERISEMLTEGALGFMAKPYDLESLKKNIAALLNDVQEIQPLPFYP